MKRRGRISGKQQFEAHYLYKSYIVPKALQVQDVAEFVGRLEQVVPVSDAVIQT